ncbi:triple tyrosine motif-containing protein [Persicobacter psychrovividus]|uniref:Two component regulator three Y domain-containing protein n=1 Tax=Persicobacter psychrovividus TaxID=387638 RepID=A0ABM7VMK2_9BACT|nr:hypothetical protein PEPS_45330 [Persicobacter psychrovividus]
MRFLVLIFILLSQTAALANHHIDQMGLMSPKITVFSKTDYQAENQNWDIDQSDQGTVYIANTLGLLQYDGEDWQLYETRNMLRSVHCKADTIYVGGNEMMGYFLEKDLASGFHPLTRISTDIWKIYSLGERVIFQAFNRIYFVDAEGHIGFERIKDGSTTTYSYPIGQEIYYQKNHGELLSSNLDGLQQSLSADGALDNYQVTFIEKLGADKMLLATQDHGLFYFSNGQATPIDNQLNELLKKLRINKVLRIGAQQYAFGTMSGGVIIGDLKGHISQQINTQKGLPNNRVHGLMYRDDLLWICTDNGIALLDLDAPIYFYHDQNHQLGSVYDIAYFEGYYYVGSNQGLFYFKPQQNPINTTIHKVEGSDGQVWNLSLIGEDLLCGHNTGTYTIKNHQMKKISDVAGGYQFLESKAHPGMLYQSTYHSVAVYKKIRQQWVFQKSLEHLSGVTRDLAELPDGRIVVTGFSKKANVITLNETGDAIVKMQDLMHQKALRKAHHLRVFSRGNHVLVSSKDTAISFPADPATDEADASLLSGISYFSPKIDHYRLISKNKNLSLFDEQDNSIIELPYYIQVLGQQFIHNYEQVSVLPNNQFGLSLSEGFAILDLRSLLSYRQKTKRTQITAVTFSDDRSGERLPRENYSAVPYKFNTFEVRFSAFNFSDAATYQYKLVGYHDKWQNNGNANEYKIQNLPVGTYSFKVRNTADGRISKIDFRIRPPFYWSKYAIGIYVILQLMLIFSGMRWYKVKLKKQKMEALKKERSRLNKLRTLNNERMLELEAKQLKVEIDDKTKELSKLLLESEKKKEVIESVKHEISNIREQNRFVQKKDIDRLDRIIDKNFDEKKDWLVFESAFSETHAYFFKKLKTKHPRLTDEDLRLCAYIKVNLTTKELASIFNITHRSMELKRYRLKKKMELPKEVDLKTYIFSI